MPTNAIDASGLQIQTSDEIVAEILNGTPDYPGMYAVYGSDINVDPNSPDGQMINIIAQAKLDVLQFLQQIYNSMDPDQAVGVSLDQRCAINGVFRQAGSYTVTNITLVVDRALTLAGLDTAPDAPFTVSDASGNQFQLITTYVFSAAGTQALAFQAKTLGAVQTIPNTITTVVTITLGILSVNNPTAATSIGLAEETDYNLRIRRSNSVALPSKGFLSGLYGALIDTVGVTSAVVLENDTNAPDSNGVPAHSIWCIVTGGALVDIANVIYTKRNAGCGMKGAVTYSITQVDGTTFVVLFDRPTNENLYISFNTAAVTGTVDRVYIRNQLLALLSYSIGQSADASAITALLKSIAPNVAFSNVSVSGDGSTYFGGLLAPTAVNYQFQLAAARIIIDGSHP